ncbi:hypothetical protein OsJ_01527 [Oryza sativa Japonica Group]|uniref:Uncharacterized protein n=1 Tax=Oryza sativa subsp. japonica TaxID=39947 RepID=B9EW39_ORYSJ|nr:hypothetical protein OsJ_01527 [Oryza sativa Japonica Group]
MSSLLTPSTAAIIASRSPSTATSAGLPNLDAYESFTVIDGLKPKNVRAFVDLVFARQLLGLRWRSTTRHRASPRYLFWMGEYKAHDSNEKMTGYTGHASGHQLA